MKDIRYTLAAMDLLIVLPAALFMTALLVRNIQPLQFEPAHTAQQIVNWYAASPRIGLWLLLMALPLIVLVTGCVTLRLRWNAESELRLAAGQSLTTLVTHLSTVLIAASTLAAGGFRNIVALHVLTD